MPNLFEPPVLAILRDCISLREIHFHFMFEVDDQGKCRLRYPDFLWHEYNRGARADFQDRLGKVLRESGSPKDYRDAKEFLKL